VLAVYWIILLSGTKLAPEDSLALTTFSLVLFFWGICGYFLGRETVRALAFPLVFLVFMVPFPICLRTSLETALQYGSADAAHAFFTISGMPFLRDNVAFHLPGFSLQVAPECSGIRSTLALFITSLLAGHLYLRSPWKRAVLTVSVILIALLRNGFRVFVIGQLCVHIGPEMIDSPIHRHGGPVFFALSLIPFGVLLLWLVHLERRAVRPGEKK
jgi:exosortase C (VPDSG-CTERM-specific)